MVVADTFLMKFIEQRMREMGYEKFHFDVAEITVMSTEHTFGDEGEYYYFVITNANEEFIIKSSDEFLQLNPSVKNPSITHYREFNGRIDIAKTTNATHIFEFIKVIPEVPKRK